MPKKTIIPQSAHPVAKPAEPVPVAAHPAPRVPLRKPLPGVEGTDPEALTVADASPASVPSGSVPAAEASSTVVPDVPGALAGSDAATVASASGAAASSAAVTVPQSLALGWLGSTSALVGVSVAGLGVAVAAGGGGGGGGGGTTPVGNPPPAPSLTLANDTGVSGSDRITRDPTLLVSGLAAGNVWQYSTDGGAHWQTGSGNQITGLSGDGQYSVLVRQMTTSGETSSSGRLDFTLQTVAAAPTLVLANDTGNQPGVTSDPTIAVTGLLPGASWQYSVDGGASWQNGSGNLIGSISGDGTRSVIARQTDVAGNLSLGSVPLVFTLETAAPAPVLTLLHDTGVSATDKITSDPTVAVGGLSVGASWQYSTDNGASWQSGSGTRITGLGGDGVFHVIARQTDGAGNASPLSAPLVFSLASSASAPALSLVSDSGVSNTDGITSVSTIQVGGLAQGATWQYSLDGGTVWRSGSGNLISSITTDGQYSVIARQTDPAGNLSPVSTPLALTFQRSAQVTITADSSGGDHVYSLAESASVALSGSVVSLTAGGSVQVVFADSLGHSVNRTGTVAADGSWSTAAADLGSMVDGLVSVSAMYTDLAGNTSVATQSEILAKSAATPVLSLVSDTGDSASDKVTHDSRVQVDGLAVNGTWQYSLDGGSHWLPGSGSTILGINGDGTVTVIARQTDAAGNASANSAPFVFTLDTTASISIGSDGSGGDQVYNAAEHGAVVVSGSTSGVLAGRSITVSFTSANGASVSGTAIVQADASWTCTPIDLSSLHDGSLTLSASVTDVAGNTALKTLSETLLTVVNSPGLVLETDTGSSRSDRITSDANVRVSGLATDATWEYSLNGGAFVAGTGASFILPADGVYTVNVHQTDTAGNTSTDTVQTFTLDTVAPVSDAIAYAVDRSTGSPVQVSGGGTSHDSQPTIRVSLTGSGAQAGDVVKLSAQLGVATPVTALATLSVTDIGNDYVDMVLPALGNGTWVYTSQITDVAGNVGALSGSFSVVIQNTAIVLSLVNDTGGSASDLITRDSRITVANVQTGNSWQYSLDNGAHWSAWTTHLAAGDVISGISGDGQITVIARQKTGAGSLLPASDPFTFTLDTTAPQAALTTSVARVNQISGPAGEGLGTASAASGDINRDGVADLIVGAPLSGSGGQTNGGVVYVLHGKSGGIGDLSLASLGASAGFRISGNVFGGGLGSAVALPGDVNGDGFADMALGAPGAGMVYVVYGASSASDLNLGNLTPALGLRITGSAAQQTGLSVAGAGDVNGDGSSDLLIGALGSAYLVFGTALSAAGASGSLSLASLTASQGIKITGSAAGSPFTVAGAGVMLGDGLPDVLVGVQGDSPFGRSAAGSVYVLDAGQLPHGSVSLSSLTPGQGVRIVGANAGDHLGSAMAAGADINGDGVADLVLGAPGNSGAGMVYVLSGAALAGSSAIDLKTLSSSQGFRITGGASDHLAGSYVALAGDVNGAGYADILVGDGTSGAAYVIYGHAGPMSDIDLGHLTPSQGFAITSASGNGFHVAAAGDLNGDGLADLMVSFPGANQTDIIYGQRGGYAGINLDDRGAYQAPLLTSGSDSGFVGDNITSNTRPGMTGTTEAHATIQVFDGSTQVGTTTANASGAWSFTFASALAQGVHAITTKAVDLAGNTGPSSAILSITIDSTPPTLVGYTETDVAYGQISDWASATTVQTFSGGGSHAGEVLTVYDGTTLLGSTLGNTDGSWQLTAALSGGGSHTIKVSDGATITSHALLIDQAASSGANSVIDRFTDVRGVRWGVLDVNGDHLLGAGNDAVGWLDPATLGNGHMRLPSLSELLALSHDVVLAGGISGLPPGWANGSYWTADSSGANTHSTLALSTGATGAQADSNHNFIPVILG